MKNTCMENDVHIFRLTDVYLMKAEALVRLNINNGEATDLVNIIRERGFGNAENCFLYRSKHGEIITAWYKIQDILHFKINL